MQQTMHREAQGNPNGDAKLRLASAYRPSKNVVIKAVIIAELKFRDVKGQVVFANLVKGADYPRLKILQKPSIVLV